MIDADGKVVGPLQTIGEKFGKSGKVLSQIFRRYRLSLSHPPNPVGAPPRYKEVEEALKLWMQTQTRVTRGTYYIEACRLFRSIVPGATPGKKWVRAARERAGLIISATSRLVTVKPEDAHAGWLRAVYEVRCLLLHFPDTVVMAADESPQAPCGKQGRRHEARTERGGGAAPQLSPLDSFSRSAFTYVNVNVTNQSRALEGQPTQYALPRRRRRQIALPRRRRRQVTSRPRTCRARPAGPAASVPRRRRCRTQATRRHLPNGAARPRRRSCHSERHQHAVGAWVRRWGSGGSN